MSSWTGQRMGGSARTTNRLNGGKHTPRRFAAACKICKLGIYDGDERVWLTDPMGLSHAECVPVANDRVQ